MEDYIIIVLLGMYLFVLFITWLRCLIFIIKDFIYGGTNEDI